MINPNIATVIIVGLIIIFGVILPVLDIKFPKFISYRWCVMVVVMALTVGAVVDFRLLSDEARRIVLIGGLVIAGAYIVLRTFEKAIANGWLHGANIKIQKGDASASFYAGDEKGEEKDG